MALGFRPIGSGSIGSGRVASAASGFQAAWVINAIKNKTLGVRLMYPRNAASPERIAIGQVVLIADGTIQSTGVAVTVRGQGGAEGASGGTIDYGADNTVYYTPTQAETDFTSFVLIASKASCFSVSQTVITTASATPGKVVLSGETHTGAVVPTVTNLTNLPAIPANWLTAAGIAADALDGKGDWNIGKTGYSISGAITNLDGLNNFNPTTDTVANVTLVATTTTNTDMRGTDDAALATALATAQNDLTIITGADGVNLLSATQASIDAIELDSGITIPNQITALNNVAATDIVSSGPITTSGGIASSDVKKVNSVTITGDGSGTPFDV